jgi:hypothetical protein
MAPDRGQWEDLLTMVMDLQVPQKSKEVLETLNGYQLITKDSAP